MNKSFTDIFIKRPVLACVVSLLILVVGLAAIFKLPLRQYPKMENTIITVTTAYPGASAQIVKGFITTPLAKSVGSADGIDYVSTSSQQGVSVVSAHIQLNYDPNAALTEITGKVNAVLDQLPKAAKSPVIQKETGAAMPDIILGFSSKNMNSQEVSAYLDNVVVPKINSVGGISQIQVWGEKKYAMRVWLNPEKMALLGITPAQVQTALVNNNVLATAGQLKGNLLYIPVNLATDIHTVAEFNNLVVKDTDGAQIHLRDVADVQLGTEEYDTQVFYNGAPAIFMAVTSAPDANPLSVVANLLKKFPDITKSFPADLKGEVVYNTTKYISSAIDEVIQTIIEATIIVVLVIFLFLGSVRSVLIPVVTIPLSLVGVCTLLLAAGFSLNLMTLLAMVLAIGMVVDDAIVVLENIYRHIEEGLTPFQAAIKGAREITGPVIVMTTTLVAVFAPIALTGGLTGALFTEFAFTLALTVVLSGVIALTLSPMLTSKIVNQSVLESPLVHFVDRVFEKLKNFYQGLLQAILNYRSCVVIFAFAILGLCGVMMTMSKSELAPQEDQSFIMVLASGPDSANLPYLQQYNPELMEIMRSFPGVESTFQVNGVIPNSTSIFGGMILKDWSNRTSQESQMALTPQVFGAVSQIPGLQAFATQMPSLPGTDMGPPIKLVITSTGDYPELAKVADEIVAKAMASRQFMYVNSDLKFDKPQLEVSVDRAKAAALGIQMSDIANALNTMLGGNLVNYFTLEGYSYEVIPQVSDDMRRRAKQVGEVQIATSSGKLIPLSSLVSFKVTAQPASLSQFQQLNSTTISVLPLPFMSMGSSIVALENIAKQVLPKNMGYDFTGESRQYVQEGSQLLWTFLMAIIIIYLVLAAQFESFRDPFIILVSVPLSIFGAMLPIFLGYSTLNIYTEIGLITLIGLISKHGILMVEFANKQQELLGLSKREAIESAAAIRLRPILMTTFAMIVGVLPLVFASGAGAVSRHDVGLVIACGMAVGTLFTLFVVPTVYTYLAQDRVKVLAKKAKIQVMPD